MCLSPCEGKRKKSRMSPFSVPLRGEKEKSRMSPFFRAATFVLVCVSFPACAAEPPDPEEVHKSVHLDEFTLAKGPVRIKGVRDDASGLTYNPKTKSLFLVINGRCEIVELSLEGRVKRVISTVGFSDIEGITHVKDDVFYVAEEGRGTICRITIQEKTEVIRYDSASVIRVAAGHLGNKGLEGLTYDPDGKRFFAVKESSPRRIYEIAEPEEGKKGSPKVKNPWNIQSRRLGMRDLSGIYYHRKSGHLLILSDESSCLVEATLQGQELSRLSLKSAPQAEGVTMDDKGNLYICSEPNLFFVYKKKQEK
jgi:uncharacterized protein YjiK